MQFADAAAKSFWNWSGRSTRAE